MCGIFGYIGPKNAIEISLGGIRLLEYRGYDSAGIATILNGNLKIFKDKGKVNHLSNLINSSTLKSHIGISHTRWATHGVPDKINAHPHASGKIALVHNGIIENHQELKSFLSSKNFLFESQTDSEVLAHFINYHYREMINSGNYGTNKNEKRDKQNEFLEMAVKKALKEVTGAYGLAILCADEPEKIIIARKGSPLIIGLGQGEVFLSSDASAIIPHTKDVIYLQDNEVAVLKKASHFITDLDDEIKTGKLTQLDAELHTIEKHGFDHFMLKEIFEQPETIQNTYRGRINSEEGSIKLDGMHLSPEAIKNIKRILILACGTSWHSAMVGEYLIENLAGIPVDVDYASEFTYRNCIIEENTMVLSISQSGETADTLSALKEAKQKGGDCYSIVNVVASSIARETQKGMYLHAGPEIGVASTKAFTSQVTALLLIAILIGRKNILSKESACSLLTELEKIPKKIQTLLDSAKKYQYLVKTYFTSNHALYLGRGYNFPVALEGALKLKEISYIHAEGYPAAEMKHGPIALIDKNLPVIVLATNSEIYQKVISNIREVQARKGRVVAIATQGDKTIADFCEKVIYVPDTLEPLSPLINTIPLQLIAYYAALERGCDVDQPRNLAKSVTVE